MLCTNGGRLTPAARRRLTRNSIDARTARVARLTHRQGMVTALEFADGEPLACDAVFFTTSQYPQDTLAARLERGLATLGFARRRFDDPASQLKNGLVQGLMSSATKSMAICTR